MLIKFHLFLKKAFFHKSNVLYLKTVNSEKILTFCIFVFIPRMTFHKQPIPDYFHWNLKMSNMEMAKQIKIYLNAKYCERSNIISRWDHIATWKDRFFSEQITECTVTQQYTKNRVYRYSLPTCDIGRKVAQSCPTLLHCRRLLLSGKPHW